MRLAPVPELWRRAGSPLTFPSHRLEERRKAKGAAYYERKKLAQRKLSEAKKTAKVDSKTADALASYGY